MIWGQLTGCVNVGVTIRVGLRPFDAANWLRGGKKHPPAFGYSFEFSTEMTLPVLFSCLFFVN